MIRKPGAFAHYRYREEQFPTSRFRMTFELLEEQLAGSRVLAGEYALLQISGSPARMPHP
jgi:hypothetical protein